MTGGEACEAADQGRPGGERKVAHVLDARADDDVVDAAADERLPEAAGVYLPGEHCLLHGVEAKFARPVFIGDTLTVKGTVTEVNDTFKEITVKAEIFNQEGKKVTRGLYRAGLAR